LSKIARSLNKLHQIIKIKINLKLYTTILFKLQLIINLR